MVIVGQKWVFTLILYTTNRVNVWLRLCCAWNHLLWILHGCSESTLDINEPDLAESIAVINMFTCASRLYWKYNNQCLNNKKQCLQSDARSALYTVIVRLILKFCLAVFAVMSMGYFNPHTVLRSDESEPLPALCFNSKSLTLKKNPKPGLYFKLATLCFNNIRPEGVQLFVYKI